MKDQINRQDDTLTVGVEVLEAVREIEHIIQPPVPLEDVKPGEENQQDSKALEGSILFHRHVNNRMLDQVNHSADMMKSRMIRRVEWKVEQASMLRRCFPIG